MRWNEFKIGANDGWLMKKLSMSILKWASSSRLLLNHLYHEVNVYLYTGRDVTRFFGPYFFHDSWTPFSNAEVAYHLANILQKSLLVPLTSLSQTLRCHWQFRVQLGGVIDTSESSLAVSLTLQSPAFRCHWHREVMLSVPLTLWREEWFVREKNWGFGKVRHCLSTPNPKFNILMLFFNLEQGLSKFWLVLTQNRLIFFWSCKACTRGECLL